MYIGEETWQASAEPSHPSYHHYYRDNRHHVPRYRLHWEGYDITSVVLLPQIRNSNPFMRKHQINTHWGMFHRIIGLCSSIMSRSRKTKTDWEMLPENGDWRDKTTKEKVVLWHYQVNWCNLCMDGESNNIIMPVLHFLVLLIVLHTEMYTHKRIFSFLWNINWCI